MSDNTLFKIAVVADKYEIIDALKLSYEALLSRYVLYATTARLSMLQLGNLIAAAYLLQQPKYFTLFTRRLILDYCAPFSSLTEYPCADFIPLRVLRKSRNALRCRQYAITDTIQ